MVRESHVGQTDLDLETVEQILDAALVSLAVLFGSYARGESTETSDVDIAVEFEESLESSERTTVRLNLIERLGATLETDPVDVVPLADTPLHLRRQICEEGTVLVGSVADLEDYCEGPFGTESRAERLAEFDEILADLDQVL